MCEYCSRSFNGPAPLKDHISTDHLGTVEHRCDQCGKVLSSVTALRLHQRQLHQDDYKRTCDGCGRQFSRTASLLDHITCMHPHLLPEKYRSRLNTLVCKQCNITFARRTSLQRHIEVKHGGAPKYMCSVCSRRFGCRKYVLKHFRAHHPDVSASKRCVIMVNVENEKVSVWYIPGNNGNFSVLYMLAITVSNTWCWAKRPQFYIIHSRSLGGLPGCFLACYVGQEPFEWMNDQFYLQDC